MSTLKDFDIGELVLQLNDELKFAFEIAHTGEAQSDLRLDQVVARFGKEQAISEDTGNNKNGLLKDRRYPNEENWEIEVAYRHNKSLAPIAKKSKNESKSRYNSIIIKKLGKYSITNIKGVTRHWQTIMKGADILCIEDLILAAPIKIQKLCKTTRSFLPMEFKTKATLLRRTIKPLEYSEFNEIPLSSLLLSSPAKLTLAFKNKLSEAQITELQSIAAILFMVIDQKLAIKLKMSLLSKE